MGVKEKVIIFTEELAAVIVLDKLMDSVTFVILSEAKDLLSLAPTRKQILRFAQDDSVCEAWN
jgi:hypothetical protein